MIDPDGCLVSALSYRLPSVNSGDVDFRSLDIPGTELELELSLHRQFSRQNSARVVPSRRRAYHRHGLVP